MTHSKQKPKRDLLFWSGGKDAYLALLYYRENHSNDPVLLTTYDDESDRVPHQDIPIKEIYNQSIALELPLITVPLSYPASNKDYLNAIENAIGDSPFSIQNLVFGDLHLEDIRKWREEEFQKSGYECLFPIWGKSYEELFFRLFSENVKIVITGVADDFQNQIEPGSVFDRKFVASLPDEIDPMGERGEFHTQVIFDL